MHGPKECREREPGKERRREERGWGEVGGGGGSGYIYLLLS